MGKGALGKGLGLFWFLLHFQGKAHLSFEADAIMLFTCPYLYRILDFLVISPHSLKTLVSIHNLYLYPTRAVILGKLDIGVDNSSTGLPHGF